MEENWYAIEQQVHDRLTEARAAARTRGLLRKLSPTPRRAPYVVGIAVIRIGSWVLARAVE